MARIYRNGKLYGSTIGSDITYVNASSGLSATTVQEAIDENARNIKAIIDSKGQPNGIATLNEDGQIPNGQLPADLIVNGSSLEFDPNTGSLTEI